MTIHFLKLSSEIIEVKLILEALLFRKSPFCTLMISPKNPFLENDLGALLQSCWEKKRSWEYEDIVFIISFS
jgi:hypothetical protein